MAKRFEIRPGDRVVSTISNKTGTVKVLYGIHSANVRVLWDDDSATYEKAWTLKLLDKEKQLSDVYAT